MSPFITFGWRCPRVAIYRLFNSAEVLGVSEDKFIQVNGLRLHYRNFGGVGKPALLFLHGLTGNVHCFDHVAPEFVDTHHAIALDFRGHGDSEWHRDGDYAFQRQLNDTIAFLERLGVAKVSLIGSSLGGAVAMVLGAIKPDLIERVVLNDIGAEINLPEPKEAAEALNLLEQNFSSVTEALEYYRRCYPPAGILADTIATELVRNSLRVGDGGALRWKADPRVQAVAPTSSTSGPSPGMWPLFDAVKAPVLVIRGAESETLLASTVAKMVSRRAGVSAVEVPGVGHTPWLSEPEALAALREFLLRGREDKRGT
jgi:esterase